MPACIQYKTDKHVAPSYQAEEWVSIQASDEIWQGLLKPRAMALDKVKQNHLSIDAGVNRSRAQLRGQQHRNNEHINGETVRGIDPASMAEFRCGSTDYITVSGHAPSVTF